MPFTAAIEIDPNQEILYEKLSEVYLQDGDVSAALQILRDGFKVTRSIHLQEVIDNLYARMDLILGEYYLTEDWVKADEWTIHGVPFWQASQNDVATAYATSWSSWKPFPDGPETLHYNTQRSDFFWDTEANVLQVMFLITTNIRTQQKGKLQRIRFCHPVESRQIRILNLFYKQLVFQQTVFPMSQNNFRMQKKML